jgi:hypothetical protein
MNIHIKTIPHKHQRYETVGDWFYDEHGNLQIRVSEMPDARFEQLVAVHELLEALECDEHGVEQEAVDLFDMQYERDRQTGDTSEPGDSHMAPYYEEHQFATGIERLLAQRLGVNWQDYKKAVNAL